MLDWAGCEAAQLVGDAPVLAEYEGAWHHAGSLRRTRGAADNGRLKATVWVIYEQAWKYVRDATGAETLYDLDADPGETAGAGADAPRASLRRQLAQALEHRRNQLYALILANDGWTRPRATSPTTSEA